ncbi:hypothetical protein COT42_03960 [Candidatus Saganbacteria bacterium CG08_land_8_20_14_0_20_45_16]|uniref:Uncharacterized protein n=1 Tax=Candidatus Saganbacteria bacterium CG08_land_8_20_14_0_20_45_16 TaxID=2014293 RepID=A0A2H0XY82_UNCSA|nr:MAG: hypothetical protein COT42_03960 [Candidatus Saganbacteria bacterium CG08_land_8_20_14_0_20_45_16]
MMRVLKVEQSTMVIEINYDDVGILHYALYDYLVKVEARLKRKGMPKDKLEKLQALKDNLQSMVETINGLI